MHGHMNIKHETCPIVGSMRCAGM